MNLKNLFTASALVAISLGFGLITAPVLLMTMRTGQPPDVLTAHVARQFGTALLVVGVISWMARRSPDSPSRNAVVTGLALLYVLLPIETAFSIARGSETPEGYVLVVVFGALAAGFLFIGRPKLTL